MAAALVAACATGTDPASRLARAEHLAGSGGLSRTQVEGGPFHLTAFLRATRSPDRLVVYLEGDGDAWHPDGRRVRAAPPPLEPVALSLAARDPAPAVAWLGRPCQLVLPADAVACEPSLWSDRRFAEPVVAALDEAVDRLRARTGAPRVELVGFSGGGVLAALLVARRDDVSALVTVAAPLDLGAWRSHHGLGALESADPARLDAPRLLQTPQLHWVGGRDPVVPPALLSGYAATHPDARIRTVPDRSHEGWAEGWAERIEAARAALAAGTP